MPLEFRLRDTLYEYGFETDLTAAVVSMVDSNDSFETALEKCINQLTAPKIFSFLQHAEPEPKPAEPTPTHADEPDPPHVERSPEHAKAASAPAECTPNGIPVVTSTRASSPDAEARALATADAEAEAQERMLAERKMAKLKKKQELLEVKRRARAATSVPQASETEAVQAHVAQALAAADEEATAQMLADEERRVAKAKKKQEVVAARRRAREEQAKTKGGQQERLKIPLMDVEMVDGRNPVEMFQSALSKPMPMGADLVRRLMDRGMDVRAHAFSSTAPI